MHDIKNHRKIRFNAPEEIYDMLVFMGSPSHYCVKSVYSRDTGAIAAVSSTDKLSLIAGRYVGKDDPTCVVRSQGEFPAVGEVLEPFALPIIVEGWMRGSHQGPWMPCAVRDANPTRFDGPPRIVCLGFQLANGKLVGPRDMFDDPGLRTDAAPGGRDRRLPAAPRPLRAAPAAAGGDGVHHHAGGGGQARRPLGAAGVAVGKRLLLATNNPGKAAEYRALLAGCGWELVTPRDLGLTWRWRRLAATTQRMLE